MLHYSLNNSSKKKVLETGIEYKIRSKKKQNQFKCVIEEKAKGISTSISISPNNAGLAWNGRGRY